VEQLFRGWSSERNNRMAYHVKMRGWLEEPGFRAFMEGETREVPAVLSEQVRRHLGPLWEWLPAGALDHDPQAYLASTIIGQIPLRPAAAASPAAQA
jgi:hypothetical protein